MKIGYIDLVDAANAEVETIPLADALALYGNDDVAFIDLREKGELRLEGRIPGAHHVPRGMLEFWIDPASPYHKPVFSSGKRFVFFCAAGWRSALAAKTAKDMGLPRVCHIEGGFAAWKLAGGPVDGAAPDI